jgi:hypothetical protein
MVYENKKKNDQITGSSGQSVVTDRKKIFRCLFSPIFTEAFYSTPVVCHSGSSTILKDGLPRYHTDARRFLGFTQGAGIERYTSLFNPLLCREKAAKKRGFEKLLATIFNQVFAIGMLNETPEAAIDSTGLETHHISHHFVNCTKRPSYFRRIWPKITVVCDTHTHLIASCIVTRGPSYDYDLFAEAVGEAYKQVQFKRILADGGYDSEANHRLSREVFGMETMIKLNYRGFDIEPKGEQRRKTKEKFDKKIYNNRWQIESVFSRNKRLLGSALRNRSEASRERECLLRALTHNLMILRRAS